MRFEIDDLRAIVSRFPAFEPHAFLRNGHLQTVAATIFGGRRSVYRAARHAVLLEDGDVTILHDDRPNGWQPTCPTALLIHGLAGCHQSPYMVRTAERLNEAGVRTFRMDMRACGAGEGRSRMPYHGGCSDDLFAALNRVAEICPASPINLVGFSVGGNVTLKLLGESPRRLPPQLSRSIVINPPIDLGVCVDHLSKAAACLYDRYFAKSLYRQFLRSDLLRGHAPHFADAPRPRGMWEFDNLYTAAVWGFETVDRLYANTSSLPVISDIQIPTLLIASRDDPLIPVSIFEHLELPPLVTLHLTDHGGHLGFIGRKGSDPDCRWMDWRIVDWITSGWATSAAAAA